MWTVRVVAIALLALLLVATWLVGVKMGRPDLIWGVGFGAMAGMPTAVLVLATSRLEQDAEPQPEPIAAPVMQGPLGEGLTPDYMALPFDVVMLQSVRNAQSDCRQRGEECADVDEWIAQNSPRIISTWPAQFRQFGLTGDTEEWLDDAPVESPASQLWRIKRTQEDARQRGWTCPDVDAWLNENAERIEAECRAKYAQDWGLAL